MRFTHCQVTFPQTNSHHFVTFKRGRQDFRFCGFGQCLVQFFGFRTLKLGFFGFGVFHGLWVFIEFSLWFSVFANSDGGFSDFFPVHFTVFLFFPRKLHPVVALKPVSNFKRPYIQRSTLSFKGMDNKPSLFSSRNLGRNGKAQDNIKTKDYLSNITRLG